MKILWLVSWYPSRIEPFNGDFVQRHAEAVSHYHDIQVIHVIKDSVGAVTKSIHIEQKNQGRLNERIIYYHNRFDALPFVGRLFSVLHYGKIFKKQITAYLHKNGKPDLVHVHVCMKAGLLALWLERKFGLRYVVTEHSTLFLQNAETNIYQQPLYYKKLCAAILKNAQAVTVVSHHLGDAVQAFLTGTTYEVIPNVVNTGIFFPVQKTQNQRFEFIHISSLSYQKNFDTILSAISILKTMRKDFVLRVFGPHKEECIKKVATAGLESFVIFYKEVSQRELASYLQKADALILFSRYETFGCVLIEAVACGVPVIVNNIPPMSEIVDENSGLIVENNAEALIKALLQLMEKKLQFDAQAMVEETGKKYGYEAVGKAFSAFYETVLSKMGKPLPHE